MSHRALDRRHRPQEQDRGPVSRRPRLRALRRTGPPRPLSAAMTAFNPTFTELCPCVEHRQVGRRVVSIPSGCTTSSRGPVRSVNTVPIEREATGTDPARVAPRLGRVPAPTGWGAGTVPGHPTGSCHAPNDRLWRGSGSVTSPRAVPGTVQRRFNWTFSNLLLRVHDRVDPRGVASKYQSCARSTQRRPTSWNSASGSRHGRRSVQHRHHR